MLNIDCYNEIFKNLDFISLTKTLLINKFFYTFSKNYIIYIPYNIILTKHIYNKFKKIEYLELDISNINIKFLKFIYKHSYKFNNINKLLIYNLKKHNNNIYFLNNNRLLTKFKNLKCLYCKHANLLNINYKLLNIEELILEDYIKQINPTFFPNVKKITFIHTYKYDMCLNSFIEFSNFKNLQYIKLHSLNNVTYNNMLFISLINNIKLQNIKIKGNVIISNIKKSFNIKKIILKKYKFNNKYINNYYNSSKFKDVKIIKY